MERKSRGNFGVAFLFFVLIMMITIPLWSASQVEASSDQKKYSLKFAIYNPPTHLMARAMTRYLDNVPKMTNGRLTIKPYMSGELFPPVESVDGIQRRIADITLVTPEYHTGTLKLWGIHQVPGIFDNARSANLAYDSGLIELFQKALDKKGFDNVQMVAMAFNAIGCLATKKNIVKTPSDFKGMKIKVSGNAATTLVKSGGGSSVAMSSAGVYEALQRGLLDGILTVPTALESYKWTEVLDYVTDYPLMGYSAAILVSKKTLSELPPDLKAILLEVMDHSMERLRCQNMDEHEIVLSRYPKYFKEVYKPKAGEIEAWKEASKPILAEWLNTVEDKNLANEMLAISEKCRR